MFSSCFTILWEKTKTKNKIYKAQVKPLLYDLFNSVMDIINIPYVGLLFNLKTELSTYLSVRTAQATKTS